MRVLSLNRWVKLRFFVAMENFIDGLAISRLNVSENAKVGHYIFALHAVEKIL